MGPACAKSALAPSSRNRCWRQARPPASSGHTRLTREAQPINSSPRPIVWVLARWFIYSGAVGLGLGGGGTGGRAGVRVGSGAPRLLMGRGRGPAKPGREDWTALRPEPQGRACWGEVCLVFRCFFFFFYPPHQRFPVKAERDKCTSRGQPGTLGVGAGTVDWILNSQTVAFKSSKRLFTLHTCYSWGRFKIQCRPNGMGMGA